MNVLRGQEASLEPSKHFYKGSKSFHTVQTSHDPRSMKIKIIGNPLKSVEIDENLKKIEYDKSSEVKKPAWSRANVSIGDVAPFCQNIPCPEIDENHLNLCKSSNL